MLEATKRERVSRKAFFDSRRSLFQKQLACFYFYFFSYLLMKWKLGTSAAMWDLELGKFNSLRVKKSQRRARRLYRSKDSGVDPEETCFCSLNVFLDLWRRCRKAKQRWNTMPSVCSLLRPSFMSRPRWFHVHASWKTCHFWDQCLSPSPDIIGWLWLCRRCGTTMCLIVLFWVSPHEFCFSVWDIYASLILLCVLIPFHFC